MKSSHRRALAAALTSHRCPSCNRSGSLGIVTTRPGVLVGCGCGAHYGVTYSATERPTGSGHRVVATVEALSALVA